jgi:nucleosome binding factor SPN SPT16 subunit
MQHDLSATRLADKGVGNVAQQLHVESTNECEEERERERGARVRAQFKYFCMTMM